MTITSRDWQLNSSRQAGLWWRDNTYMKRAVLLKSLMIGFAILLIPSTAIMQWITHTHPVYRLSLDWMQQSPQSRVYIGEGVESGWWVTLKSSRHTHTANVTYTVYGSKGRGEALVSARQSGDDWELNYIWYRPEGSRVVALLDRRPR